MFRNMFCFCCSLTSKLNQVNSNHWIFCCPLVNHICADIHKPISMLSKKGVLCVAISIGMEVLTLLRLETETFIECQNQMSRILESLTALSSLDCSPHANQGKLITLDICVQTNSLDRGTLTCQHCQNVKSLRLVLVKTQVLISTIKLTKIWYSSMFYLIGIRHLLKLNKFIFYKRKLCKYLIKNIRWYPNLFLLIWWYAVEKRLGTPDLDFQYFILSLLIRKFSMNIQTFWNFIWQLYLSKFFMNVQTFSILFKILV